MIGSTVIRTGTISHSTAQDHRFALLTARAGLEPDLAQRYTNDPLSVLTEFGLPAGEPVYLFGERSEHLSGILREDLDSVEFSATNGCYSNFTSSASAASAASADVR